MMKRKQDSITIEKRKEMRTREIANMISEGGIGAENYYVIKKSNDASQQYESESMSQ